MGRKYQLISADGHVETPPDSWICHLDEQYRPYAPQLVELRGGGEAWLIEGQQRSQRSEHHRPGARKDSRR